MVDGVVQAKVSMADFFVRAGGLKGHEVREEGETPRKSFTSCFTYEGGYAEYLGDGRNGKWTFWLPA